jgi:hypothetical protein
MLKHFQINMYISYFVFWKCFKWKLLKSIEWSESHMAKRESVIGIYKAQHTLSL